MNSRINESIFAELNIHDKKTILAIYLAKMEKKTISSDESKALHVELTSNKPLDEKFNEIKKYLLAERNIGKNSYNTLKRAIQKTQESNTKIVKSFGPWKMAGFEAIDDDGKYAIIKHLERQPLPSTSISSSVHSTLFRNILRDKNASVFEKWSALIYYCSKKTNSQRNTYEYLICEIETALSTLRFSLIQEKNFDAAYSYTKFSRSHADSLVYESILSNAFKREYLSVYDFSKSSYKLQYINNEVVNKTFRGLSGAPDSRSLRVLVYPVELYVIRPPMSFFAYQSRNILNQQQISIMLQNLSQLSELLSPEEKKQMMQQIAKKYNDKFKFSKSYESKTLVADLNNATNIQETWKKLIKYVLHDEHRVLTNNGTRLFNYINDVAAERTNQLFPSYDNRP